MVEKIRVTYDVIELMGSIGGVNSFFSWMFGFFVASFASMNFQSLIANRFYSWNAPASFKKGNENSRICCSIFSGNGFASKIDYTYETDEKKRDEIPVPTCLFWWQFAYKFICCWCKGNRYRDYQETLATVN
jgi:hypothetical protein